MAEIKSIISLVPFIAALLAGLLLFSGTAAGAVVSMDPSVIALRPGESTKINLTLDNTPTGLSGYKIGIKIEQPGIAEVTAVTFPSWAGIPDGKGIPGSDVQIAAVDLNDGVKKNAVSITLATVSIKGLSTGTTKIILDNPEFDEDGDNMVEVTVNNATLTIVTSGGTSSSAFATGSGGSGSSTMPGAITSPSQNQSGSETPVQTSATGESQTPMMGTPAPGGTTAVLPTTGDQEIPEIPSSPGIPFLSLPFILVALGIMAFLAAKKR